MTPRRLREILAKVSFAPSCVDMGWEWEVKQVCLEDYEALGGMTFGGSLIRTTFQRPDRDTGVISKGFGRWWHVPEDVTESGVVKTAYAAARLILEHELMESFKYDGDRIFDPHHTIDDLSRAVWHHEDRESH